MVLVIGIGNPLRRDDGAGWLAAPIVAQALSAKGISTRTLLAQQLLPEHALELDDPALTDVCFVDVSLLAATPQCEAISARVVADVGPGNRAVSDALGHQLDPATLLAYATLFGRLPRAWLICLPGIDFDHGQGLSPEALAGLAALQPLVDSLASIVAGG